MAKPEGSRGELVEDGGVAALVVAPVVALGQQVQLVQVDGVPAEDPGQELVPGDVLFEKAFSRIVSSSLVKTLCDFKNQP